MRYRAVVSTGAELRAKLARDGELLTCAEVGELMTVDPKTPARWNREGRVECVLTPGRHRRFRTEDIRALMASRHTGNVTAAA